MKKFYLSFILLAYISCANAVVTSKPPEAPQPLAAPMGASWLIFRNVNYVKGILIQCNSFSQCDDKGYTPEDVLEKKLGKDFEPVGISPYLDGYGNQIGVILYYRKKQTQ